MGGTGSILAKKHLRIAGPDLPDEPESGGKICVRDLQDVARKQTVAREIIPREICFAKLCLKGDTGLRHRRRSDGKHVRKYP